MPGKDGPKNNGSFPEHVSCQPADEEAEEASKPDRPYPSDETAVRYCRTVELDLERVSV